MSNIIDIMIVYPDILVIGVIIALKTFFCDQ